MLRRLICRLSLLACVPVSFGQDVPKPVLKTATHHSMEYYLSLPQGWSAQRKWPVVVVIESANREFLQTATIFARARKDLPFILVTPMVVTNGGPGYRNSAGYQYTDDVWNEIERGNLFDFDYAGIAAVVADMQSLYGGQEKYFLTGWEAGGHTVWAVILQHPEVLRAAAPVSTNYLGRWLTPDTYSNAPERNTLPVQIFQASGMPPTIVGQIGMAKDAAEAHGFKNVTVKLVNKAHSPLADEVLQYFASLLAK